MTITKHAIIRFQERITSESPDVIRLFIKSDIKNSKHLYSKDNIEKSITNGIVYVVDYSEQSHPVVITLYLA